MVAFMKVNGLRVNNMGRVNMCYLMENKRSGTGNMVKGVNGLVVVNEKKKICCYFDYMSFNLNYSKFF